MKVNLAIPRVSFAVRVVVLLVAAFCGTLCIAGPWVSAASAATVTRGPFLQSSSPTSIVIRWRTDVAEGSRVRYGNAPNALVSEVSQGTNTNFHEIKLDGLTAGARYYYSVETLADTLAGHDNDHYFDLPPATGSQGLTRLLVLGDSGNFQVGSIAEVRDAYYAYDGFDTGNRPDLVMLLGDNAYYTGLDTEYQQGLFDPYQELLRNTVLWPTRGNHDNIRSGSNNDYYDFITMPENAEAGGVPSGTEAYYSFDRGNIHIICLDSEGSDLSTSGSMMTWLQNDIAATTQDWIVAFFHHAPYTKSNHDSDDPVDSGGKMMNMRANALPILEAGGVDLVLTGHGHSYERSFLLDGHYSTSSTLDPSMIVSADPDLYVKPTLGPGPNEGTVYLVLGSSSLVVPGLPLDHPVMVAAEARLGFVVVEVDSNRLDAVFVDNTGVERDRFTMFKGSSNGRPSASFTAVPGSGFLPLDVAFDASSSIDPDGHAMNYSWDFGDGNFGNGVVANHVYNNRGAYIATLTVDDGELWSSAKDTIFVSSPVDVDSVIAYWPLDETGGTVAPDIAGLWDGALVNGPVWQPGAGFAGALEFDGVDDRVDLGTIDVGGGTGFSVAMRIRADDFGIHDARLISKANGTAESAHWWMLSTINGTGLRFRLKTGSITTTLASITGQIQTGVWYHVVATYDGAEMRIYKDGDLIASQAKTGVVASDLTVPVAIGNQPVSHGDPFDGLIDDVRLYNVALSEGDVRVLAGGNLAPVASFTALPDSGQVPLTVSFDASASFDTDGPLPLSYSWDFGDGAPAASGVTTNHTYNTGGSFLVTLSVTDGLSATGVATKSVQVDSVPMVAAPTISPNGGTFGAPVDVTLATATSGAFIYFTTDGSAPTTASDFYTVPFTLDSTATVMVRAFKDSLNPSTITQAVFTIDIDSIPPAIVSATAADIPTQIAVVFSEPVEVTGAETATNYSVDQGISVTSATLAPDLITVTLACTALDTGLTYTLTVNNVEDRADTPNEIVPGSQVTFQYTEAPPQDADAVVLLPLDESGGVVAGDISGKGNDGTLVGGAAFEATSGDGSSHSVRFDGASGRIDLGPLDVNGGGLTLACWMNADAFPGGSQDPRMISKATSTSGSTHLFMLSTVRAGASVRLRGRVRVGGAITTLIASSGDLATGEWRHAALTYDGSMMRLHLDGVVVGTAPLSGPVDTDPSVAVAVGGQPAGAGNRFFDGLLDDVRILERALTETELLDIVTGEPPVPNDPPVASFTALPDSGQVPLTVSFDASASFDTDGPLPLSYSWDFGDGAPAASGVTTNHTYNTGGSFLVTLSVTDGLSATGVATKSVQVDSVPMVAAPTISPNGGTFGAPVDVTLATATSGAFIYFTTDGSAPTTASDFYTVPFTLDSTATVMVRAFKDSLNPSTITQAVFTIDIDSIPPAIVSATAADIPTQIAVVFSEPVEVTGAETATNYSVDQGISVTSATLAPDLITVTLACTALDTGLTYTLTVNNVEDRADTPNEIVPGSQVTFQYTEAPPQDADAVVVLPLDESGGVVAGDISGKGNDGTLVGGAAFEATSGDGSSHSVRFDGASGRIDLGPLDVNGGGLTLACWMNADAFPGGSQDPRMISKATSTSGSTHLFMLSTVRAGASVRLRGRVRVGGAITTLIASSGDLATGEWRHAALTYDGSMMRLHLDGVVVGTAPLSGPVDTDPSVGVAVGGQPAGAGNRFFDGLLDDVRILERALTETELLDIVTGEPPVPNDPPVALDDVYGTQEDSPLVMNAANGVLDNDTDPDFDALSAALVTDVSNGALTLNGDGSLTYMPSADFNGVDSFTYRANDGSSNSNVATVTLNVSPLPDAPIAVNDGYQTNPNQSLMVSAVNGVLANDRDPDGDSIDALLVGDVSNGALVLSADGSFVYTPDTDFNGTDSFTYTAMDALLTSNLATVTIAVGTENTAPYLVSGSMVYPKQTIGVGMDETHGVAAADFDGDNDIDVVATDYLDNSIFLFESDGAGGFSQRLLDGNLGGAYPISVGDVDLDGDMDVLACGYLADTIVWYENDGGGNFTRRNVDTAANGAHSVVTVDMDDDGDNDLLTTNQDGSSVDWYENLGGEVFTHHLIELGATGAKRAEAADFDGDGDLDVVSAAFHIDEIAWHENDGNENFTKHSIDTATDGAYYVSPADVDGDGDIDIFSASQLDNTIALFVNNGSGSFTKRILDNTAGGARTVLAVDIDGDGHVDALSASVNDDTVARFMNDGFGNFTKRAIDTVTGGAYGLFYIDMDYDGDMDVLSAGRDSYEITLHEQHRSHQAIVQNQGGTLVIDSGLLRAQDANHGAASITYTITDGPASGELRVNGTPVPGGGTFTQDDIDQLRLSYVHDGSTSFDDSFSFTVSDGIDAGGSGTLSLYVTDLGGGLMAHWQLDETSGQLAADAAGGNDGTLYGGPVWQPAGGRVGGALRFDGNDDVVDIGSMDISSANGMTIAMWIRPTQFLGSSRLISKTTSGVEQAHYWMISTYQNTALRFRLKTGGDTSTLFSATGELDIDQWYHVACTYDQSEMRIYGNGVLLVSLPKTGPIDVNAAVAAAIGDQPPGAGADPFAGDIDDVRIYTRALIESEIVALANNLAATAAVVASADEVHAIPVPREAALHQNTPNPFNPSTTIHYDLPDDADVTVQIFDVGGRLMRTLVQGPQTAGSRSVLWDGRDNRGQMATSGVYFVRMRTNGFVQTRKIVLIK